MKGTKIILVTGMPGSGKTTLTEQFKKFGYNTLTMGDVVRENASRMGVELSPGNLGRIAEELRIREGKGTIAKRCIEKIEKKGFERVVIDGIRSLDEVEVFEENNDTELIAVHSSPVTRFRRLVARGRSDDVTEKRDFKERDVRELGFGIGNAIALAEYMIINEGSIDEFITAFGELIRCLNQNS